MRKLAKSCSVFVFSMVFVVACSGDQDPVEVTDDAGSGSQSSSLSCEEACEEAGSACSQYPESQCKEQCDQRSMSSCVKNCFADASSCPDISQCEQECGSPSEPDAGEMTGNDSGGGGTEEDTGGGDDPLNPNRNCPGWYDVDGSYCPSECPEFTGESQGGADYCSTSCDNGCGPGLECYQGTCRHMCESASDCPTRPYDWYCQNLAGGDQKFCQPVSSG